MKAFARVLVGLLALIGVVSVAIGAWLMRAGPSTRPEPGSVETRIARAARHYAIPTSARSQSNPVQATPDVVKSGREHWADHCASCHANDGSGNTEMGRSLYPKAPDMRVRTQQLSDGEIFYFIENGVRLTGMPAWATGTPEGERASWQLVNFIRRLPKLTPDDIAAMEKFNPTSRAVIEEEKQIEDFLNGGDPPPAADSSRRSGEGAKADPHAGHKKQ